MISKDSIKEAIKKLRDELPRGSASEIQKRLNDSGFDFAINTINATLDENNPRFNEDIFNEAIRYRDFLRFKQSSIETKIMAN